MRDNRHDRIRFRVPMQTCVIYLVKLDHLKSKPKLKPLKGYSKSSKTSETKQQNSLSTLLAMKSSNSKRFSMLKGKPGSERTTNFLNWSTVSKISWCAKFKRKKDKWPKTSKPWKTCSNKSATRSNKKSSEIEPIWDEALLNPQVEETFIFFTFRHKLKIENPPVKLFEKCSSNLTI